MDVLDRTLTSRPLIKDELGERVQKLFQDFLESCTGENGELKYLADVKQFERPERNTLTVSFEDVEQHSTRLSNAIQEQYYRLLPYLCNAVKNFTRDQAEITLEKQCFLSFVDFSSRYKYGPPCHMTIM
jgi:DNA replication licensing factor MCM6